jgi:hypothetical protein
MWVPSATSSEQPLIGDILVPVEHTDQLVCHLSTNDQLSATLDRRRRIDNRACCSIQLVSPIIQIAVFGKAASRLRSTLLLKFSDALDLPVRLYAFLPVLVLVHTLSTHRSGTMLIVPQHVGEKCQKRMWTWISDGGLAVSIQIYRTENLQAPIAPW